MVLSADMAPFMHIPHRFFLRLEGSIRKTQNLKRLEFCNLFKVLNYDAIRTFLLQVYVQLHQQLIQCGALKVVLTLKFWQMILFKKKIKRVRSNGFGEKAVTRQPDPPEPLFFGFGGEVKGEDIFAPAPFLG